MSKKKLLLNQDLAYVLHVLSSHRLKRHIFILGIIQTESVTTDDESSRGTQVTKKGRGFFIALHVIYEGAYYFIDLDAASFTVISSMYRIDCITPFKTSIFIEDEIETIAIRLILLPILSSYFMEIRL